MTIAAEQKTDSLPPHTNLVFDKYFVLAVFAIIGIGLLMVASASMVIAERLYGHPFYYLFHQLAYLGLGFFLALIVLKMPMAVWEKSGGILLLFGLFLLVLVLVPGIGHQINGSTRWIGIGPIGLQVSEFIKLAMVVYLAGYLVRHQVEVKTRVSGFLKPMLILGIIAILLLKEPDFGATVVIACTTLAMMYLAGVRAWQFIVLLGLVLIVMSLLAISSPYRLERLTSFLNPWQHEFDSGYQLTQSLIAFGRGGIFGVGLGDSIQKLFYLPEADTDFLFAVLAEELGLVGVLVVIGLYVVLVGRALFIGRRAQLAGQYCSGLMAYGFAVWLAMQVTVNIGVDAGLLPTKGLTLPLMSYGGSSMLINCIVIAILLRIDYEARTATLASPPKTRVLRKQRLHRNLYRE